MSRARAWAAIMRSKGSRCGPGSRPARSATLEMDGVCFGVWKSGETCSFVETGTEVALITGTAF